MEDHEYKVSNYMQLYSRIVVNSLVMSVRILANLLVKLAKLGLGGGAIGGGYSSTGGVPMGLGGTGRKEHLLPAHEEPRHWVHHEGSMVRPS